MEKIILIRYGEIYLKGRNRSFFERCLADNIKLALKGIKYRFNRIQCRYILEDFAPEDLNIIIERLKQVIGIHSISIAFKTETDKENMAALCAEVAPDAGTFRVTVNRADKTLTETSQQLARYFGYRVLEAHPSLKVDLFNPDKEIVVDIRENKTAYIYFERVMCLGGMPVGSSGKGLALLSGGIDSPVACFRMAKRGMTLDAIHFQSFPYTSAKALEKTVDIAKIIARYAGDMTMFIVSFTEIQEAIHKECPAEFMITIMRRIMMRIAERTAIANGCGSLITGESLAQVASQTQESITVTNKVIENLPVFRPLIGMDKDEIIKTAREINTFELSILPYEDCCTVFLPKNPVIKPKLEVIEKAESRLDVEALIASALEKTEVIKIEQEF